MSDIAKDLFCGWMSGIGQVLTMMPFQNVKIKLVSKPDEYTGIIQCFKKSLSEEGVMSFYKGMLGNLMGVGPQVAFQFATVETLKKFFKKTFQPNQENLSIHFVALSGFWAGLPSALIVTPLDHARFRVALSKTKVEGGSIGLMKSMYQEHGLKKLYLGFNSTWLRQAIGLATYFTVYNFANKMICKDPKNPSLGAALLSGGLSGVFCWLSMYPIDFVKTLIQCDDLMKPRHNSMMGYLTQQINKGSILNIFRGVQIMLIRAFVVNAAGFMCYEIGRKIVYPQPKGQ